MSVARTPIEYADASADVRAVYDDIMAPPLIATSADVDEIVGIIESSLQDVVRQLSKEGIAAGGL